MKKKRMRINLKRLLGAVIAAAMIACGIFGALLTKHFADSFTALDVSADSVGQTNEQDGSSVGVSRALLPNGWTVEPTIGTENSFAYHSFGSIAGAAEHGEVVFTVYVGETPVNAVLTDFMLTDGKVSEEVGNALNTLNVGTYLLNASVQAEGYEPLSKSVEFTVTQLKNKWLNGRVPQLVSWVWGDEPKQIYTDPATLAGDIVYTLEGDGITGVETYDSVEAFNARIGGRTDKGALGSADRCCNYTAKVFVVETENYTGLSIQFEFRVKKKIIYPIENDEPYNGAGFYIESFPYGKIYTKIKWNILNFSVGFEATRANFSVTDEEGNIVVQHDVILNDGADPTKPSLNSKKAFIAKISMLDAGHYTVRADVFEGETYGACSSQNTLVITRAVLPGSYEGNPSIWETEPYIDMSKTGVPESSGAVWEFEKVAGIPTAKPRPCARWKVNTGTLGASANHIDLTGELIKTYYKRVSGADGDVKGEKVGEDIGSSTANMPTAVGKYFVEFSVRESNNYYMPEEGIRLLPFEITYATDKTFTTNPYAVGWIWGTFNKNVNLFGAVPTRGGAVDFTVKKDGTAVSGLEHFRVDAQNVIIDENDLSEKLNRLDCGIYTLEVNVAAAQNYVAFTAETKFSVSQAPNQWTVSPNIVRWAQYYFKAEENTPRAAAQYGDIVMEVSKKDGTEIYYRFENGVAKIERLDNASAGWYTFKASVEETINYSGLYYVIEFQIFSESADMPNNYWEVVPSIESWIAGTTPSVPLYKALRGTVLISYCKAELQNGKYVAVGDATTEQPNLPGKYFMLARVRHESLPQDELLKHDVMFEIFERINEWTVTPSIQSYTLGEGPSAPVAEVLYTDDCVIEIRYKPKYGETVTSELPRSPGEYVMIVTATAKYCAPLTAEVEFTVSLSHNSWVNAPTIKDWSEEFAANSPFGEALVGNEHIKYFYARADKPDETFTEKPTSEGSYIMYATLEMDGYETLTAQWEFSVTSAYNGTLLAIDIVLGVLCSACTVVVIVFAVKRNRQNG